MHRHRGLLLAWVLLGLLGTTHSSRAQSTDVTTFFENKIRPLLVEHCFSCHGAEPKKIRGGLDLTTRRGLLEGGETSPAIVPGKADQSLLIRAVRYHTDLKMPPKGKLAPQQIADLTTWVNHGAHWPASKPGPALNPTGKGPLFTKKQQAFWSFHPMIDHPLPKVKQTAWPKNGIDHFILAKLEAKGLKPAAPADRRTLLRRVTFDLTGLPPTPAEIDAFLQDTSADAFAKVVDRLLASPAYGERWARHWLDVVRYADSNGLDENTAFGNAWRYRDYVVNAFNQDRPYPQFIIEQLAGDLLPPSAAAAVNDERLTATGFLTLGPKLLAEPDKTKMVMDIVDEQIDVVSKTFLGLTVSCARCHDHKFDPIPTRDYYALAGIFKSTKTMATLTTVARVLERPLTDPQRAEKIAAHNQSIQLKQNAIKEEKNATVKAKLQKELEALKRTGPAVPLAMAVQDEAKIANVKVHIRGNHLALGAETPRQFLQIIAGEKQTPIGPHTSGRLELAQWLARPDHPLTARVMVNRIWQHHFGQGIVRSPDNFGKLGELPTHPELLDWLAKRFIEKGWSLKALHRLLLLSNTYQMSTTHNAEAALLDPENKLHWRRNRRRLEIEAIRDSMLFVSGQLDRSMGGNLLKQPSYAYVTNDQSGTSARYDSNRRSLYLPVIRNNVYDVFQVFDFVEPSFSSSQRAATTVAPQALFLLNGPFVQDQAKAFAKQLLALPIVSDTARLQVAFAKAFGRQPLSQETEEVLAYLQQYADQLANVANAAERRQRAWASFCQVLLAANEFVYVN